MLSAVSREAKDVVKLPRDSSLFFEGTAAVMQTATEQIEKRRRSISLGDKSSSKMQVVSFNSAPFITKAG